MSNDAKFLTKSAAALSAVVLIVAMLVAVGCPQYKVYKRQQDGKAALAEAKNSKLVQIEEARANLESEKLNAQAEFERAKGAARAIAEEKGQLTPEYIQYLWVRSNRFNDATTIYIPTEAGLPILEAGKRPTGSGVDDGR